MYKGIDNHLLKDIKTFMGALQIFEMQTSVKN